MKSPSEILDAATGRRGRGHKSPVRLWLEAHQSDVQTRLTAQTLSWRALATELGEQGLRDANGRAPGGNALQAAWHRIVKAPQRVMELPVPAFLRSAMPDNKSKPETPTFGTIRKKETS